MAGYSGTPLPRELGIKAGHRVAFVAAPPGFDETWSGLRLVYRIADRPTLAR